MQAAELVAQRTATIMQQSQPELKPPLAAEYAQLRLQREFISNPATSRLPAAANLFRDKALEKLAPGSAALQSLDTRMRILGGQLFGGQHPTLDSPEMAAAVAALAQFDIERLQASLMRKSQQVWLCMRSHNRVGGQALGCTIGPPATFVAAAVYAPMHACMHAVRLPPTAVMDVHCKHFECTPCLLSCRCSSWSSSFRG